jgi:hypothetical protein
MRVFGSLSSAQSQAVGLSTGAFVAAGQTSTDAHHTSSFDLDRLLIARAVDELIVEAEYKVTEPSHSRAPSQIDASILSAPPSPSSAATAEVKPANNSQRIHDAFQVPVQELEDGEVKEDADLTLFACLQTITPTGQTVEASEMRPRRQALVNAPRSHCPCFTFTAKKTMLYDTVLGPVFKEDKSDVEFLALITLYAQCADLNGLYRCRCIVL